MKLKKIAAYIKSVSSKKMKTSKLPKFKRATFTIPGKYTRNLFLGGDNQ